LNARWARPGPHVAGLPAQANRLRADLVMMAVDALLVFLSFAAAMLLRFDGSVPDHWWAGLLPFVPVAVVVFIVVGSLTGLYRQIWRYASIHEARLVLIAGAVSGTVLVLLNQLGPYWVPFGVVVGGSALATVMLGATRFQARLFSRRKGEDAPSGLRVVIVGAGSTGIALARQMLDTPSAGLVPVAFLDDDPAVQGRRVLGIDIRGGSDQVAEVVRSAEAHQVLLAVPDASPDLLHRVTDQAEETGAAVRIVPGLHEIVRTGLRLQDVRQVSIEDLLGRQQVSTDLAAVAELLAGKRVLVTGAGGSIGSEICRQVAQMAPAALLLLDHDDTHLHDASATIDGPHELLLVDVRDADRVRRTFERYRPEVVFHAAAHKHVPLLEDEPGEAVRTNVLGTVNLLRAARMFDTGAFVFISTDKAVRPSSVMGASKRVAEYFVTQAARDSGARYSAVRFGNVLGSRGSVIPTFVRQIESGGPVTITDARMSRYFMSIPEAVQLVLQAAALSRGGELFMLEMGEAVKIVDLAQRMIRLSGRRVGTDIEIRVVGVRPGEKLREELSTPEEETGPTSHPSVTRLVPVAVEPGVLDFAVYQLSQSSVRDDDESARHDLMGLAHDPQRWATEHPVESAGGIDLTEKGAWSRSTF
jgi:FlaA1/EpsC-like NDP-sugar epimerase